MNNRNFRVPGSSRPSDNGLYLAVLVLLCAAIGIGVLLHVIADGL